MIQMAGTVAMVLGLVSLSVAGDTMRGTSGDPVVARSYLAPRIDGRAVDARLAVADPANPAASARAWCRAEGYSDIEGFSLAPAAATVTLADGRAHGLADGPLIGFHAIRCAGRSGARAFAGGAA